MDISKLSQDYLLDIIDYDFNTGICTWKTRPRTDFQYSRQHKAWNNKHSGEQAGTINPSNCKVIVSLFGRGWYLDQLLTKMMTDREIPTIYHKNGCAADNTWENLSQHPQKTTKYSGGDLVLTKDIHDRICIAAGDHTLLLPPITLNYYIYNFYINYKTAHTTILELADKLQTDWYVFL